MHTEYEGIFQDWEIAIARKIVNDHRRKWPSLRREDEDFLLNGCLDHWHRRRDTYREEREATMKTYMGKVLKNYLLSYLRKELAEKRKTNHFTDSLDRPLDPENPDFTLKDKVFSEQTSPDPYFLLDLKASLARLTPRQREICHLLMEKTPKTEIAGILGLSRDTIHEEQKRIREIFRKDELEKYF